MSTASETVRLEAGIEYGPLRGDEELEAHIRTTSWSFRISEEECRAVFERMGHDKIRVLRVRDETVAGLSLYPAGQWFGGRSVPMAGIGLVGVAPEARGQGTATHLMNACVLDARARGHAISTLYPAKQTLYRRSGWELAGGCWTHAVPARDLAIGERTPAVRPWSPEDGSAVRDLHRRVARSRAGEIDRCDFLWRRVVSNPHHDVRGFLVDGSGGLDGYVFAYEAPAEGFSYDLVVNDFAVTTREAALRLLRLLGDHATLARDVRFQGGPIDPVFGLLREQRWRTALKFQWMVRIVDVPAALEARGYPEHCSAELHLEVDDPVVPENRGRFVLEVDGSEGRVRKGGEGRVRLHVRSLASVYAGYLSSADGRRLGLVQGEEADLQAMDRVFAGPTPWMTDMF